MAKSKNRKGQKLKSKNRTNKIMDQQRKQERDMAKMLDQMQKQKVGKDSESETPYLIHPL